MTDRGREIEVLTVGLAAWDLVLGVPSHPGPDEKLWAHDSHGGGGGPAATSAVAAARLGRRTALLGYLGRDSFGALHLDELEEAGVVTDLVVRGAEATPLTVACTEIGIRCAGRGSRRVRSKARQR